MNIVVIGLGSMGKRRIRLLKQYILQKAAGSEEWNIIGVDLNPKRCRECNSLFALDAYSSLEEASKHHILDCAIVSTAPITHAEIIKECLKMELHVFAELNLVDKGYDENIAFADSRNKVLFLSSTFLYRREIQYIKKRVREVSFRGMYQYHVGQYLPDWHPWESYKDFFVGHKDTNACREILAIEIPWLIDTFGQIKSLYAKHKKITQLDIEYDDGYQIMLEHESGIMGCLIVDVVTPITGRRMEMWQEKFCISWGGTADTIAEYDAEKQVMKPIVVYENVQCQSGYNQFVVENAYYDELVNFFEVIEGKAEPKYSFKKDKRVLELIDQIEE